MAAAGTPPQVESGSRAFVTVLSNPYPSRRPRWSPGARRSVGFLATFTHERVAR
jgi:hypothetical protein